MLGKRGRVSVTAVGVERWMPVGPTSEKPNLFKVTRLSAGGYASPYQNDLAVPLLSEASRCLSSIESRIV